MSENDYQQLIERMLKNDASSPMISSDTGVEAAQQAGQLAVQEEIECAMAGDDVEVPSSVRSGGWKDERAGQLLR